MKPRHTRSILHLAAALSLVGAVAAIAAGLWLPPPADDLQPQPVRGGGAALVGSGNHRLPSLASLEPVMSLDLRRPLYDPPPGPRPTVTAPRSATLALSLVGTAIEPGRTVGIFVTGSQAVELKGPGARIETPGGPIEVLEVGPEAATVRYAGKTHVLEIETDRKK